MAFREPCNCSTFSTGMRHRGQQLPYDPSGKLRTRQHVIADMSCNFLERKVLLRGHWLDAPRNDYGVEAIMFHHNERGEAENGEVRFQLKATDNLRSSRDGKQILQRAEARHDRYWFFEPYPVFVVVYDAARNRAYWLDVQASVGEHPKLMDSDKDTTTLRIPVGNSLDLRAIDRFRKVSLERVARYWRIQRGN